MPKFLTGTALNLALEKLFEEAEETLILISPYIKLHPRFISILKTKLELDKLEITIVFGKNETDKSKSLTESDFEFLKTFRNIRILYEPNLHAKYYANESSALITSMNLYSYSQDRNIEAGVLIKKDSLLNNLANNLVTNVTGDESFDREAEDYFDKVIDYAETLFDKEPQYDSVLLGLHKKFKQSIVVEDRLTETFLKTPLLANEKIAPVTAASEFGFCIRTRKKIAFDPSQPLSPEALESWNKFKNKEYPEKYCHFSGEPSNGLTSFSKPILRKNWNKAKQHIKN